MIAAIRGEVALVLALLKETDMTQWRKKTADEVYEPDDITARLAEELPKWYLEDGWIRRKYKKIGRAHV